MRLISQFAGVRSTCRNKDACVSTLTSSTKKLCPLLLHCDPCQVAIQHQCPSAEAFRAEIPLNEIETRRDHWNKVIAQQMIPKEGRVSHISFEQDKKQSAKRYYDLRTTVIDSMHDYTNIITIASQLPAWFFSPKELVLPLKECLHEINYCDNSFIQESFTTNVDTMELKLRHHDFIKPRDYHKWLFYHIILGPEQCFHLKSVHFERDEWKVRYYDELIIRTFERASIFITLPLEFRCHRSLTKLTLAASKRHIPVWNHLNGPPMLALSMPA